MNNYLEELRGREIQPTLGELCYRARLAGSKWSEIQAVCPNAMNLAKGWALGGKDGPNADWPIKDRDLKLRDESSEGPIKDSIDVAVREKASGGLRMPDGLDDYGLKPRVVKDEFVESDLGYVMKNWDSIWVDGVPDPDFGDYEGEVASRLSSSAGVVLCKADFRKVVDRLKGGEVRG